MGIVSEYIRDLIAKQVEDNGLVACPEEAIQLTPKPEPLRRTPPANAAGQMAFMAETWGIA